MTNNKLIFKFFFSLALLSLLFYCRLIPRQARDLWENMTHKQLFFALLSIAIILINIYSILKKLGYVKTSEKSMKIIELIKKGSDFVINSLVTFYELCMNFVDKIAKRFFQKDYFYFHFVRRILLKTYKEKYLRPFAITLFVLNYLPKTIFLCAIVIDVIVFHRFDYTFKCIPLLLIPLIERFVIFVFKHYFDIYHQDIYNLIEKRSLGNGESAYCYVPEAEETPPDGVKDFKEFFLTYYLPFYRLEYSLERYDAFMKNLKKDNITLFFAIIRLFVAIFVLIFGIF